MTSKKNIIRALCAMALLAQLPGCASVKPYEREYLSKNIMRFDFEAREGAIERHWLEILEGSSGGIGGAGGGCACN